MIMSKYGYIESLMLLVCILISAGPDMFGQSRGRYGLLGIEVAGASDHLVCNASPAVWGFVDGFSFSDLSLYAGYEAGNLHRPQVAENIFSVNFDALGSRRLGRFYLNGGFRFRQGFENGVRFASTFDPLRDNPYFIADSTGGDWKKQSYDLWADVAFTALEDRLSVGLGASVSVGRGAKQIDPRPQADKNRISFVPSLAYNAGKAGIFAISLYYSMLTEISNLILYDSSRPQKLYLMKGLGQYTYEIFSNTERERKSEGDDIGLGFGYIYRSGRFSASVSGKWLNGYESTYDIDYSKPHTRGRLYSDRLDFSLRLSRAGEIAIHDFSVELGADSFSGREVVQVFDSSPDVNSWVTDSEIPGRYLKSRTSAGADYGLWLKKSGKVTWHFGAGISFGKTSERYDAMASYMNYSHVFPSADAYRVFYAGKGYFRLGIGLGAGLCTESGMAYVNREDDDTVRDGLIGPDYAVLSSDTVSGTASLMYAFGLKNGSFLSVSADGGWRHAFSGLPGCGRYSATLSLGYSF